MNETTATDWVAQHDEARQALLNKGGLAGLAKHEQLAGLSGLEVLRGMMDGQLPYPPMNDTMDLVLLEADVGRVVFQGRPALAHFNPLGTVHGGWFAALLDSALGCAVQTMLPAGRSYTTAEISLNIVRPATLRTGPLRATGLAIHAGRQMSTAEARVVDQAGKLYAHATTTCFIFDVP
jgi:uncharacterized protein (TIGR00369 family)